MVDITPENAQSILNALIAKTGHVDPPPDTGTGTGTDSGMAVTDSACTRDGGPGEATRLDDSVPGLLAGWGASVRGLVDAPCATLSDRQLTDHLVEVDRLRRASDAAYLRLVAEVDARGAAPGSRVGAVSTANLLTAGCGASPGRAKADLDAAHALYTSTVETSALVPTCRPGPLAGMAGMLEDGTIRLAHVDTAVRALDRIPEHFLRARENDPDAGPDTTVDNDLAGADDEVSKVLVGFFATHAPTMSPRKMAELSDELLRQIAPPTDDLFDPDAFNRRDLAISTDLAGMVHGRYQLDANAGGLFAAIIDALSGPLPQTSDDTGEVTVRDPRKPGQRRADALTEIIRLAAARLQIHTAPTTEDTAAANTDPKSTDGNNPDDAPNLGLFDLPERAGKATGTSRAGRLRPGRRAPRIVIVTTEDQVRARRRDRDTRTPRPGTNPRTSPGTSPGQEPPDGPECRYGPDDPSRSFSPGLGLVDAGMVARTACDAVFERIILDANGAILDLGTGVRLATPAQRRALEARDKGCTFPGCNRPASWCDAHHVIWFSRGGPTSIDNMALLCPAHHSLIHTGQWTMTMIDGIPYARPAPGGRTPAIYGTAVSPDGWIRNTYFDALNHAKHTAATIRHLATG